MLKFRASPDVWVTFAAIQGERDSGMLGEKEICFLFDAARLGGVEKTTVEIWSELVGMSVVFPVCLTERVGRCS